MRKDIFCCLKTLSLDFLTNKRQNYLVNHTKPGLGGTSKWFNFENLGGQMSGFEVREELLD